MVWLEPTSLDQNRSREIRLSFVSPLFGFTRTNEFRSKQKQGNSIAICLSSVWFYTNQRVTEPWKFECLFSVWFYSNQRVWIRTCRTEAGNSIVSLCVIPLQNRKFQIFKSDFRVFWNLNNIETDPKCSANSIWSLQTLRKLLKSIFRAENTKNLSQISDFVKVCLCGFTRTNGFESEQKQWNWKLVGE